MRRCLFLALAFVGFLVNPSVGCSPGSDGTKFHYGAPEMKAAVEGTWELGLSDSSKVTLTIAQGEGAPTTTAQGSLGLVRPAMACDDRTLVKSANACVDTTFMPLDVAVVDVDPAFSQSETHGTFITSGTEFNGGSLNLTLGALSIMAAVTPEGTVRSLTGSTVAGLTATSLQRISP
jgi:hypothetical protein